MEAETGSSECIVVKWEGCHFLSSEEQPQILRSAQDDSARGRAQNKPARDLRATSLR
jgi:hypothetical protein